ncbi:MULTISPECIES: PIN domain nuclease [Streptomyces]|uniref:Ribonuclease VapC n=1 Tax=Streptomyces solicathayae TaxID=3081768 RepID=A0ABZ0LXB2_9ACTN|nr:PIN domain nuclease [Streptomyces sp. HUAS YS2]WOX24158.1 PIN domain nuclease [Streptomyces sp. HUAS YS2]
MTELFLADKSALARWNQTAVAAVLDDLDERGLLAICAPVEWEMVYSARNKAESERIRLLLYGFDLLPVPDEVWDRTLEVQREALSRGVHRSLSMADLLIAATAERHGATVLHYDDDYDAIASITGQATRWVVGPGTADR